MPCVPDWQGAVVLRARTPLRDFVVSETRLDDTQADLSSAGETLRGEARRECPKLCDPISDDLAQGGLSVRSALDEVVARML